MLLKTRKQILGDSCLFSATEDMNTYFNYPILLNEIQSQFHLGWKTST